MKRSPLQVLQVPWRVCYFRLSYTLFYPAKTIKSKYLRTKRRHHPTVPACVGHGTCPHRRQHPAASADREGYQKDTATRKDTAESSILVQIFTLKSLRRRSGFARDDLSRLCRACLQHGVDLTLGKPRFAQDLDAVLAQPGLQSRHLGPGLAEARRDVGHAQAAFGRMVDFLPEAGRLELRIDERVVEGVDRAVRHVGFPEQRHPFGVGPGGADLGQGRIVVFDVLEAVGERGE